MNESDEGFANSYAFNKMVIVSTIFPQNADKKLYGSDRISLQRTRPIIFASIEDMIIRRGTDIASNHHLVGVKMKLRLEKH